jgi:hypothetical protein
LLANGGHLQRASADLERALRLDPKAPNAAAYLTAVHQKLQAAQSASSCSSGSSFPRPRSSDLRPPDSRSRPVGPAGSASSFLPATAYAAPRLADGEASAAPVAADSLTADQLRELLLRGQHLQSSDGGMPKKRKHEKHDRPHKKAKKEKKRKHEKKERKKKEKKEKQESSSSSSESDGHRDDPAAEHPILSRARHKFWG